MSAALSPVGVTTMGAASGIGPLTIFTGSGEAGFAMAGLGAGEAVVGAGVVRRERIVVKAVTFA